MTFTKAKTWACAVGASATILVSFIADNAIDVPTWAEPLVQAATLCATVYAVYKTRNKLVGGENTQEAPRV